MAERWAHLEVETPRLRIDALCEGDVEALFSALGEPDVARMMTSVPTVWSKGAAADWIKARAQPRASGVTHAVRLKRGALVGTVRIGSDPVDIGYMIAKPLWGRGYASEMLAGFLPRAMDAFALEAVEATVFDDNPASRRVLEKLGFERAGAGCCQSPHRLEPQCSSAYRVTRDRLGRRA